MTPIVNPGGYDPELAKAVLIALIKKHAEDEKASGKAVEAES